MRGFFRVLRWSLSVWRSVDTSRGVMGMAGKYMWVGELRDKCIEAMKVLLNNKDRK